MKAWGIAIVSVLVGVSAGLGGVWIEFRNVIEQFEPHNQSRTTRAPDPVGEHEEAAKAVVVDGPKYEFGKGQRFTTMKHTFVIKNEGNAPLTLEKGQTSCKCALSDLKSNSIDPGKSGKVTLEWKLNVAGKQFRQTAEIMTNDPDYSTIMLEIVGKITDLIRFEPNDIVFSGISDSEGGQAQFRLCGYEIEDFKIIEHQFMNKDSASFFEMTLDELEPTDLENETDASCGYLATLTAKPGLPLGAINQTILLTTNVKEAPKLELPITGTVVGDIYVVGPGVFDHEHNLVKFGTVIASEGAKTSLRLLVKGPYRHDVRLKIKEVTPAGVLAASLGEPRQVNKGAVYMHLLTVEVPKDARTVNCLGSKQGEMGKVLIETTHPITKELPVYVKFAVR